MDLEGWFVFGTRTSSNKNYSGLTMSRHETSPFTIVQGAWQCWWGTDSDLDLKECNVQLKSYKGWKSTFTRRIGLNFFKGSSTIYPYLFVESEVKISTYITTSPRLNPHCIPTSQLTQTRSVTELDGIFGVAQITPLWHVKGNWREHHFLCTYIFAGFFFRWHKLHKAVCVLGAGQVVVQRLIQRVGFSRIDFKKPTTTRRHLQQSCRGGWVLDFVAPPTKNTARQFNPKVEVLMLFDPSYGTVVRS